MSKSRVTLAPCLAKPGQIASEVSAISDCVILVPPLQLPPTPGAYAISSKMYCCPRCSLTKDALCDKSGPASQFRENARNPISARSSAKPACSATPARPANYLVSDGYYV